MHATLASASRAPAAPATRGRGWCALLRGAGVVIVLSGDWRVADAGLRAALPGCLLDRSEIEGVAFDSQRLGFWDSSLLAFLSALQRSCSARQLGFDVAGLPVTVRSLLALMESGAAVPDQAAPRVPWVARIGLWSLDKAAELGALTSLVGEAALRVPAALRARAQARLIDLLRCLQEAGISALPIVGLVNLLVGGIVAFLGGLQLRRWGAEIYAVDLIGVAEVREMAPLMTAVVMSGRTGSAYAAQIAAMRGSEEIDALRAFGISVFDYLVLPRAVALSTMMPLLAIYAAALGIAGGFAVAVWMLGIPAGEFVSRLQGVVAGTDLGLGLIKSLAFGAWIALASALIGLRAGESAQAVGEAATTAAVMGIVGAIALDAGFDLCAHALGI